MYFFPERIFVILMRFSKKSNVLKMAKIQKSPPEETTPTAMNQTSLEDFSADLWQERISHSYGGASFSPVGDTALSQKQEETLPASLSQLPATWNKQTVSVASPFSSLLQKNIPVKGPELTFYSVREVGQDPLHFTGQ